MVRKILEFPLVLLRSISDALARVSRQLGRKTEGSLGKTASAGQADRWLSKILAALLSPFLAFSGWLDRLSPRRSGPKIDSGADRKSIAKRLEKQQVKDERSERLRQSWLAKLGGAALAPFAFAWTLLRTRDRALLWWILPIMIVVGGLGFVVYQTTFVDKKRIAARYESAVADAINAGDFQQAELFQRKLEQLGISTEQGEFKQAFALGESGDIDAAAKQMEGIASLESPGNPSAHFWLAQHLIDGKISRYPPPTNLELALRHVRQLELRVGSLPEVQFLGAIALAKLGRLDESSQSFGEAPRQFLEAASAKMEVELARKDMTAARAAAITVQRHLSQLKDDGKQLTEVQFQMDVKSAQLMDDGNAAALAAQQWYDANPNSDNARLNAASIQLRKFDQWLEEPTEDNLESAIEQIEKASEAIPASRVDLVRRRLDAVVRGRENSVVDSLYQQLMASAKLSGNALEFLATDAAVKQQWVAADKLFAAAAERDADNSNTWNNWAYVIDQAFPNRRDEGLKYAETATVLNPRNAEYRETRGTLLLHLERWEEAIEQLEIALNGLSNSQPVHRSLATAYERLGQKRMAELHRRESGQ